MKLKEDKSIDVHTWGPVESADTAFFREAPWRATWRTAQWSYDVWHAPTGVEIGYPVCSYIWESHLDASLPNGIRKFLLAPWLSKKHGMELIPSGSGEWLNSEGKPAAIESGGKEQNKTFLIREEEFLQVLRGEDLCPMWVLVAERNAWPGGSNNSASWRRSEGVCWFQGSSIRKFTWHSDNRNNSGP